MSIKLFDKDNHLNIAFTDLVNDQASVQSNQFLIANNGQAALIDPGGELTYSGLFMEMNKHVNSKELEYVLASHQDPDIVASINRWMNGTDCKLVCPEIWERFIPHFSRAGKMQDRIISIPDRGMDIPLGRTVIKAIPAHFLHSEGNFQFYDPISKVLFSGDMGANLTHDNLDMPFKSFDEAIPSMKGFHQRYMNSNTVCRYWANMVRSLDVQWMVPQHGRSFKGPKMVNAFLDWIEALPCGVDLMSQNDYRVC
ncbi:MBL fold metallo-hydrolase [Arenicella xantha]|uniref:Metallo-beta-lactamase superfamily protein n=1 Tax=Arenicella xantha TaxID=644221 RepID=A0A395JJW7_9GAMM|nr:MBL fold metallo-hydrolase [Arenicella xantha]RBP51022.1 metallo-beta-lactamase superfamily protein [Arenicella xantha]